MAKHSALDYVSAFLTGYDAGIVEIDKRYIGCALVEANSIKYCDINAATVKRAETFRSTAVEMQRRGLIKIKRLKKGVK